jgi:hypothetical protein
MLLEWQGMHDWATYWRRHYGGGETYSGFTGKVDRSGLAYYSTYRQFDAQFLAWAIRTRRGCMVTCMRGRHMVLLVGLDEKYAHILDNNDVNRVKLVPLREFYADWWYSDSWAMVPAYTPAPPLVK